MESCAADDAEACDAGVARSMVVAGFLAGCGAGAIEDDDDDDASESSKSEESARRRGGSGGAAWFTAPKRLGCSKSSTLDADDERRDIVAQCGSPSKVKNTNDGRAAVPHGAVHACRVERLYVCVRSRAVRANDIHTHNGAVKQFLLFLNEQRRDDMGVFVRDALEDDDRRLLVNNNVTPEKIEEEVRRFTEDNVQGGEARKKKSGATKRAATAT